MGLLDGLLGGSSEDDSPDKYAVIMNSNPDQPGPSANAFQYAIELDEAGYEVQLFLDGTATKWAGTFNENPDHPLSDYWTQVQNRGVLAGACGFCAYAFDAAEACETAGVELLSDEDEHAPEIVALADRGYEIITVG